MPVTNGSVVVPGAMCERGLCDIACWNSRVPTPLRYRVGMAASRNDRSERILRTAMHLFHERGFDGVGVDLIGERAGVSGPAIYRYFSGKDEILMTLLDEAIDRVLMSTGGQFDDPREQLEHLVRGHAQRALEERELMSGWTRERNSIPAPYRSRLRARINRYIERWVECLQDCYPGQPRDVLIAAVHATHGLIDSTALWPPQALRVAGLEDIVTAMALAGLESLRTGARGQASNRARRKAKDRSA